MARTATITLDEREYVIRAFNLKELQEVADILAASENANLGVGSKILAIALRRAEPKVEDIDTIEPTVPEITKATDEILKLAGLEPSPQAAAPVAN